MLPEWKPLEAQQLQKFNQEWPIALLAGCAESMSYIPMGGYWAVPDFKTAERRTRKLLLGNGGTPRRSRSTTV